jgi:formylglycine-generating enzyme required for sulfatase activity
MSRFRKLLPALLPAALAAIVALPLAGQADQKGKKYAVLVGVKTYQSDARLADLKYTENDVEDLAKLLGKPGAAFAQVVVLTTTRGGDRRTDQPTAANIRAALKKVFDKVEKHDTVLVALAGHGVQLTVADPKDRKVERDEAFFCPADAKLKNTKDRTELTKTLISLKELFDELDGSGARVKLLLVDACRNDPKSGRNVDVDNVPRPPRGTAALFSCASGQRAFETDKLAAKGHGVFFHFVLEGLRGQARNKAGVVTWASLTDYVKDKVSDEVPRVIGGGARQSPHEIMNLIGKSPVLLESKEDDKTKLEPARSFTNSIGMKLVLIPKGKFMMGSTKAEQDEVVESVSEGSRKNVRDWVTEERPRRDVEITRPFYLGVYTVTQKQYKEVMGENPSWFSAGGGGKDKVKDLDTDDFPVERVSWEDAKKFCEKLSQFEKERRAKRTYRLPTEAEWEYSCRGGPSSNPFHFGKSLASTQANFYGHHPYGGAKKGPYLERTCKVGSYDPNKFGLYDMHGNVCQWCSDWYDKDYYKDSPTKDPKGPDSGTARVLRGGSWDFSGWACRAAYRGRLEPGGRVGNLGFRLACSRPSRTP